MLKQLAGGLIMADKENIKMTPMGKVVCTEEGCFFVSEGE